jgi:hypothetical protein
MFRIFPKTPIKRCAFFLLFGPAMHFACSATSNEYGSPPHDSHAAESNDPDAGDSGQTNPDTPNDDEFVFDTGMPTEEIDACAQTGSEAEPVQLDIVILLDRSGSMYGPNWTGATSALKQFVQDPASDGINVGLLYFPIDAPADGLVCNPLHYHDFAVPIGPLPQHAANLVGSIDAELPNGGSTPMYGALEGALWAAAQQQMAEPNHKVILVFASDGDPNSCPGVQNSIPFIAGLAKTSFEGTAVQTYVIAIAGASVLNLDQIALAGGTNNAYDVTGNIAQFAQKMADIRASALACEYVIPDPPGNEPFELEKVVVKHVAKDGSSNEIPRADGEADCGHAPGWYFDNPLDPKKIKLCSESCNHAQQEAHGRIDVFFGCKPKLN